MIYKILIEHFEKIENALLYLKIIITCFVLLIIGLSAIYIFTDKYNELLTLITPSTSLVAAYAAILIADRLLTANFMLKEKDRELEIIRISNHFLVISYELKGRFKYIKEIILNGNNRPAFELTELIESTEDRFKMLLNDKDAYKFLPRECTEAIYNMTDQIAGMHLLSVEVKLNQISPQANIHSALKKQPQELAKNLNYLICEIQKFINELKKLHNSTNPN